MINVAGARRPAFWECIHGLVRPVAFLFHQQASGPFGGPSSSREVAR